MRNLSIFIATHKQYSFPKEDYYIPIQVGKALADNQLFAQEKEILADNSGEHISTKNPNYSELTALYWIWKNYRSNPQDYISLVHYRRYFAGNLNFQNKKILSAQEIDSYLSQYDCILPKKRNYYIETVFQHYKNAHYIDDLLKAKKIIAQDYPEYLLAFDEVMQGKKLYLYNIFVMRDELFNQYCEWLFDMLFQLEKNIDVSSYNSYQRRVFGFISERLFNVWVIKNNLDVKELKIISMEKENVFLKGINLIRRKFFRRENE